MPMLSLYSASKFAVEGLSESLNHELKAFGISVRTIAPGSFDTGFGSAHVFVDGNKNPELDTYREKCRQHVSGMVAEPPKPFGLGDPQDVAEAIYKAATRKSTAKVRTVIGRDAKVLRVMRTLLPYSRFFETLHNAGIPKFISGSALEQ